VRHGDGGRIGVASCDAGKEYLGGDTPHDGMIILSDHFARVVSASEIEGMRRKSSPASASSSWPGNNRRACRLFRSGAV